MSTIVIILIIVGVIYWIAGSEKRKLAPIIDRALQGNLSQEAITILLARDATRSLGRVLNDGDVRRIERIVQSRIEKQQNQIPDQKSTDVMDVFRYLNQNSSPFLMQKNEEVVCCIPAVGLREPRAIRTTTGVYGGPSFRVAKGVTMRTGVSRSTSSSHEEVKDIDGGDLVITNQRIFFVGAKRTVNLPFKKIVSLEPYSNSIILHKDGREKAQHFIWPNNFIKISVENNPVVVTGFVLQDIIGNQING